MTFINPVTACGRVTEAVAQLRKGLDVLAGPPDGLWRRQQELDLLIALRPALAGTKGYAAVEVGARRGGASAARHSAWQQRKNKRRGKRRTGGKLGQRLGAIGSIILYCNVSGFGEGNAEATDSASLIIDLTFMLRQTRSLSPFPA
jgi:hypothetical protein